MKVSITKEELMKALSIVSKGMSSRSTLPILSGILLSANGRELVFQTTDLDISIRCVATAFVEEEGSTVVPGKLFTNIVHSLPEAAVLITTDGDRVFMECMSSSFTLNTLNPNDFPHFPEVQPSQEAVLKTNLLAQMVKKVSKAVSHDESRAVLTGILLGLLARGYNQRETCLLGVYLHGLAGDLACQELGMESLLASDIIRYLSQAFKRLKE